MVEANNYDEAMRVLIEAEHNPAGERLIQLAHVRATLAVAEELRALRAVVAQLNETVSATSATGGGLLDHHHPHQPTG